MPAGKLNLPENTVIFDMEGMGSGAGKNIVIFDVRKARSLRDMPPLVSYSQLPMILIPADELRDLLIPGPSRTLQAPADRGITEREHEIVSRLLERELPGSIGKDIGTSAQTVSRHKKNALRKLGVQTLPALAQLLKRWQAFFTLLNNAMDE